jgi:dienelactone hydrolase
MPGHEIVVFHSALGLRPGLVAWAEALRDAGHTVHTPDFYDGEVFDDPASAARKIQDIGFDGMLQRSFDAVRELPDELIYAGFSNGGACAELLAATRPGAKGAVLIGAPLMIKDLDWQVWPSSVPVDVHFCQNDPRRNQPTVERFAGRVREAGAVFTEYLYPGACHHLADPARPGYDEDAAKAVLAQVIKNLQLPDAYIYTVRDIDDA